MLVHPSLHDSGGWVCIEAMASGRPVICLNLGGPAIQVTEKTGFKVSAHNPDLRVQMGKTGRQIVDDNFNWRVVGERLDVVYQDTVKSSAYY